MTMARSEDCAEADRLPVELYEANEKAGVVSLEGNILTGVFLLFQEHLGLVVFCGQRHILNH